MSTEEKITTWIDKQSESPLPIWALSAASVALLPLAVKKSPGVPSMFQTMAFAGIFGGAGYVTNAGDSENGAGIATAWCLSWCFLNAKTAIKSMKPIPMTMLAAVTLNTVIYGKKTLKMDDRIMYKRSQCLREYVASFHLSFMFIGLAVTSIGAYFINSNMSRTFSISLLILGVIITTTSFIGCFGAHLEHTGFLNTYSSITAIALILELVSLGLAYSHKSQLDYYGSLTWDFFQDNDSKFLFDLERSIKCCGYASIRDRAVPKTCSISLGVDIGCRESIVSVVQDQWVTMGILCLLSTQLIALFVSVILSIIMDRETREEETYMALLSSQHNNSWLGNGESSYIGSSGYFGRTNRTSQRSIPKYGSTPSK